MKHTASQQLYAYWNALRGGRAAPERSDIDPAAIRGVLANTIMIEVEGGAGTRGVTLPIRLSGTRVNALFDRDLKGRCLSSLWRLGDRRELSALVSAVLDDTRPAVAGVLATPPGKDDLPLELLLLPLRHKGKTHSRLLGSLSPATIPSWFGLTPVPPLALVSHRIIEPEALRKPTDPRPNVSQPDSSRRRGHFVIYEGGRL